MNPYTQVITALETELRDLDTRRAKLIAAIGGLLALDGQVSPVIVQQQVADRDPTPSVSHRPRRARTAEGVTSSAEAIIGALRAAGPLAPRALATACGYESTNALRHHLKPLLAAGRVREEGKTSKLRIMLASPARPARRAEGDHEVVWDGSKGSASLTGSASGLGSSLAGEARLRQ